MKKFATRESFSNAVVHCFNEGSSKVEVCYWVCGREPHPNTSGFHHHMAIKMSGPKKKKNLSKVRSRKNHGIVVNFFTSHSQYYYAFQCVIKEDQEYVKSASHPPLDDMGSPQTRKCIREKRKRAAMRKSGSEASATNNNNNVPWLGKFEVSQFILHENVKDQTSNPTEGLSMGIMIWQSFVSLKTGNPWMTYLKAREDLSVLKPQKSEEGFRE